MLLSAGRTDKDRAMTTVRLAMTLILFAALPATAQDIPTADVVIESTTLRDARTGANGPFPPGAQVDATMVLRNRGDEPVSVRRIALSTSALLTLLDPASDGLDNDGDGETDEADEAMRHRNRGDATLRLEGGGLSLDPGAGATRILRLSIDKDALPDASGTLTVTAGSTLAAKQRSRPQKAGHVFTITVAPLPLTLASSVTTDITVRSRPVLSAEVTLPGGTLTDAEVSLDLPPAMQGASIRSYRVGPAISCDGEPGPVVRADRASLRLGRCIVDEARPAQDRTIRLSAPTTLKDAPQDSTGAEVAEWRAMRVSFSASDGDMLLGGTALELTLQGPRVGATVTLPDDTRYRLGDDVPATVRIANTGDYPLEAAVLRLHNDETFTCEGARVDGTDLTCDGDAVSLPRIDTGGTLDIDMRLRLRPDALIEAGTGPELTLTDDLLGSYNLPVAPVPLTLHEPPEIEIAALGDWAKDGTVTVATIGDTSRLRLAGTLPPGRYRGEVRLLARALDARTGKPVAPAALSLATLDIRILSGDGTVVAEPTEITQGGDTLWSHHAVPFDLSDSAEGADAARRFVAEIDVTLADEPGIEAGNLLEIVAETTAYGENAASGSTWIDVLVQEPDLRLKLFSLDDDRMIQPDERFGILSLACNYGESPAFGTDIVLDTPQRIDLPSEQTITRVFTVPLEAVRSGSLDEIDAESRDLPDIDVAIGTQSARLALETLPLAADQCIGMEVRAPLGMDRSGSVTTANVFASLAPYAGHRDEDTARRYPATRTPFLRFQTPVVSIGPSTTIQIGNDRRIVHPLELTVPDYLGAFRVTLESQSSAGLRWEVHERREGEILVPWVDNARAYPADSSLELVMQTDVPDTVPLGWVDTSRLRAMILTDDGRRFDAALRLVIRTGTGSARAIDTDKRVAVDRDCDGLLSDELVQDAVFEPSKDATPGDCLIVRIGFENTGLKEVERIIIRDAVSARTALLPNSATVRIAPEPLDTVTLPDPAKEILEWEFEGLFRPGAVGEVEYRLRLDPL